MPVFLLQIAQCLKVYGTCPRPREGIPPTRRPINAFNAHPTPSHASKQPRKPKPYTPQKESFPLPLLPLLIPLLSTTCPPSPIPHLPYLIHNQPPIPPPVLQRLFLP